MLRNNVNNLLMQGAVFTTPLPKLEEALCFENKEVKPDDFFPVPRGMSSENKKAKALCKECHGRVKCLDYALENKIESGIWGGMGSKERQNLRRD